MTAADFIAKGYVWDAALKLWRKPRSKDEISIRYKPETTPPKRIRQSSKPRLNKLETEFKNLLEVWGGSFITAQAMRFELATGLWYKPDFVVFPGKLDSQDPRIRAYEVKGPHAFRGGFENLKMAARQWPDVQWILVWKEDGAWKEQVVLP
jgi:hypothetical protein